MNGLQQVVDNQSTTLMIYNSPPQWTTAGARGHESPRSTKSALGTSSAMRQASRKLAKQQLFYDNDNDNNQDVQPLLAYDSSVITPQQRSLGAGNTYYGGGAGAYSASQSPRSVRSARMASRHKSLSTNENLNLMHEQQQQQPLRSQHQQQRSPSKSVATTCEPMPAYQAESNGLHRRGQSPFAGSENEHSDATQSCRPSDADQMRKRATFALDTNQQKQQQDASLKYFSFD